MQASAEQLAQVPDVGPVVAASIHTFFQQEHNREVIAQLRAAGIHWPEGEPAPAATLAGPDSRADRHLAHAQRDEAKAMLEAAGLQGGRQRQQGRTAWWPARPAASLTRRASWACA